MVTIFERQLHVCCVMGNICLVVHGKELKERHFRNLLAVLNKMLDKDGKTHDLIHLGEQTEMQRQHAYGQEASHEA